MRQVILWCQVPAESFVPHVPHNSHDFPRNILTMPSNSRNDSLAYWILIREIPVGKSFIDDRDQWRIFDVPRREVAAIQHGDSHGLKVSRSTHPESGGGFVCRRHRMALNLK